MHVYLFLMYISFIFFGVVQGIDITREDLENAQNIINESAVAPRGRIVLFNPTTNEFPQLQKIIFNTTPEDKERCIISYISYNSNYQNLLKTLIRSLNKNYKGHVLFRIGGWPGMECGCLSHSDVPYAFKVCAFKEAYELGYQKILWLDSSVEVLKDVEPIFEHIEKYSCVYRYSFFSFRKYATKNILDDFQLTQKEGDLCTHVAAGILGFNFRSQKCVRLLEEWHEAVKRKKSFYSFFPEQIPLSILLRKYGLDKCPYNQDLVTFDYKKTNCIFRIIYKKSYRK